MHKFLMPSPIDMDPESADVEGKRIMWYDNFEAFCAAINPDLNPDKLAFLLAHVSCKLLKIIKSATTHATAISPLKATFMKQKREVFAIYKLATCKQQNDETLDAFLDSLKCLASECSFTDCTAAQVEELAIRDSYITGMASNAIRQRLLENLSLDLSSAVKQACALEMTLLHSASYASETNTTVAALIDEEKVGHYARVCKSQRKQWNNNGESTNSNLVAGIVPDNLPQSIPASITGAAGAAASPALRSVYKTVLPVELNGGEALDGLVDTEPFKSFIDAKVAKAMNSVTRSSACCITIANAKQTMKLKKCCNYDLTSSCVCSNDVEMDVRHDQKRLED
ncbi:uncharacterized protein [Palaemon carinicauda]|uniref:uncharacterized protein n=1 Tax=Palaemon carinicauda TaxID=392227 RepID=UPI0035B6183B